MKSLVVVRFSKRAAVIYSVVGKIYRLGPSREDIASASAHSLRAKPLWPIRNNHDFFVLEDKTNYRGTYNGHKQ